MSGVEIISNLRRRYVTRRILETSLFATGIGLVSFAASKLFLSNAISIVVAVTAFVITFAFRYFYLKLHKTETIDIVNYLNANYATLSHSADLIVADNNLSALKQIQRGKTANALKAIHSEIKLPSQLRNATITLVSSLFLLVLFTNLKLPTARHLQSSEEIQTAFDQTRIVAKVPAELNKVTITVAPPAYTQLKKTTSHDLNISAVEGSQVTWQFTFDPVPSELILRTSDERNILCRKSGKDFIATAKFQESGFYHLEWKDTTLRSSDYYKIDISPDAEPKIIVKELRQFIELELVKQSSLDFDCTISDDFGVTNAYIVATVSKGSGESVKFREEKLSFSVPASFGETNHRAQRKLDFIKLGMEPGDELYFYVEAFDNKAPTPNKARTDTYFISLRDTAELYAVDDSGLGVDLMPEYFRSQRQIIIDTEKLIRERKKLAKKDFNFTSNELGYDQKVLRLRYGQFMGEEFESELLETTPLPDDELTNAEEEDPLAAVTHDHDSENEHNLVPEENPEEDEEDPLAKYTHKHDDSETATFFTQTIRTKLKAALTQMWDAELHLRLFQPEKSLPYQYKALELLKEISNDSRIYVHKTGLDAPPIKEEKRLSGDLKETFSSSDQTRFIQSDPHPSIRHALPLCETLIQSNATALASRERSIFTQAGNELAALALEQPSLIPTLSVIRRLIDGDQSKTEFRRDLISIRKIFWMVLPEKPSQVSSRKQNLHSLDMQLLEELKSINE